MKRARSRNEGPQTVQHPRAATKRPGQNPNAAWRNPLGMQEQHNILSATHDQTTNAWLRESLREAAVSDGRKGASSQQAHEQSSAHRPQYTLTQLIEDQGTGSFGRGDSTVTANVNPIAAAHAAQSQLEKLLYA